MQLRKLALVSMKLADHNLGEIAKYIKTNANLTELDISWNHITPKFMLKFLEQIGKIGQLRSLNISYNSLRNDSTKAVSAILAKLISPHSNIIHLNLSNSFLVE